MFLIFHHFILSLPTCPPFQNIPPHHTFSGLRVFFSLSRLVFLLFGIIFIQFISVINSPFLLLLCPVNLFSLCTVFLSLPPLFVFSPHIPHPPLICLCTLLSYIIFGHLITTYYPLSHSLDFYLPLLIPSFLY